MKKNLITGLLLMSSYLIISQNYSEPFTAGNGGTNNVFIGEYSGAANTSLDNVAIGFSALKSNNSTYGTYNTAIGSNSQLNNISGGYNVSLGYGTLLNLKIGSNNTAIGHESLYNLGNNSNGEVIFNNQQLNTALGFRSAKNLISGNGNSIVGAWSMSNLKIGNNNTILGGSAMSAAIEAYDNVVIGGSSLYSNPSAINNTIVGHYSYVYSTGNYNIGLGNRNGNDNTTGNNNITIGNNSSAKNGDRNILIGNSTTTTSFGSNTNQYNILNIGNVIFGQNINNLNSVNGSGSMPGRIGIRTSTPQNTLEITSEIQNTSGLRFTNLTNLSPTILNPSSKVLSVNNLGDVILVDDKIGNLNAVTSSCANSNFVPKVDPTNNLNLICSQIFDNGTSVGIGTGAQPNSYFDYSFSTLPPFSGGSVPISGTVKLDVNGIIRTTGIFATSDKKFKKNIENINRALETVQLLDGKTYSWNKESKKEMNFDDNLHSGFIAQDLEKVLPHLVNTNYNGEKSVNYIEVIPYLVEAIKEQQNQILELKQIIEEWTESKKSNSIEEIKTSKFITIAPNPSNNEMLIKISNYNEVTNLELVVYSLNGEKISSNRLNTTLKSIEKKFYKDDYGTGTFILNLVANGKIIDSKKIIFK
ncbi:Protein of unknown function precursor [Flavobacterium indicum GPTSA100-9 = DSM 17447]|uniref:Peptidase S74 domain-containing protein n=1 Tax=Flavobacterium indicum (strain DSM 17447 / CIP 109464 / GPTSA100-9) TaxID=1094466 RepID=H8XT83_FLAIG|nr:tail fiber domain-containing protein [Flavobacterium indicum]CCG52680.1 Protein of unknown function precursor [Flavobacterium indicum GPTSA100-9 = DSM 17447]